MEDCPLFANFVALHCRKYPKPEEINRCIQSIARWMQKAGTSKPLMIIILKAMRDLKESNPIEVAEYATKYQLVKEPVFAWWVPWIMKKRDQIISAVMSQRVRQSNRKYGIEIPSSVTEAHRLDKKKGNTFWRDSITKEMANVAVAFRILDQGERPSPMHTFIPCHLILPLLMQCPKFITLHSTRTTVILY